MGTLPHLTLDRVICMHAFYVAQSKNNGLHYCHNANVEMKQKVPLVNLAVLSVSIWEKYCFCHCRHLAVRLSQIHVLEITPTVTS